LDQDFGDQFSLRMKVIFPLFIGLLFLKRFNQSEMLREMLGAASILLPEN
jgi:hypothetical protein